MKKEILTPTTEAYFQAVAFPPPATIKPGPMIVVWESGVTVTVRSAWLQYIRFRLHGTIDRSQLNRFRLYVDGKKVGETVDAVDGQGYVYFELSRSSVEFRSGHRKLAVEAALLGGVGTHFHFKLESENDFSFLDDDGFPIIVRVGGRPFQCLFTGQQQIK